MIPLGVTENQAHAPRGTRLFGVGDYSLVASAGHGAQNARERLVLQTQAAEKLPTFLPFPVTAELGLAAAKTWIREHGDTVAKLLNRLSGASQISLVIDRKAGPARLSLRDKASVLQTRRRIAQALRDLPVLEVSDRGTGHRMQFELLIEQCQEGTIKRDLGVQLSQLDLAGWRGVVLGPVAPVSFCLEG